MKIPIYVTMLVLTSCLSASMINAMWRGHSSDEEDSPLLPSREHASGKAPAVSTAIGTAEYHEGKLAHHEKKVAFHQAMSKNLAYTKHDRLSKHHGVESFHSKDMMAAHHDFSEGIKEGRFLPGPKTQKKKKPSNLPNPPKSREEAEKLIDQSHLKHLNKGKFKHLPLDNAEEKHGRLNKKLNNQRAGSSTREQEDQSSSASVAHLAITNFR
ncbi:uncharacterized protein FA14DRAFT_160628 [Meira miltonrushii]|uniref:Uncharacterized protein n=1 Tax=Meira miltonrushii TaxID=1280837 RepID=A0A316VCZ3_9BASI|nr:uncharacterized protein FA14DRAFT_160628 [Meira miltonrushii]PWN35509.1 hypothetical protein FA14DRAFT_160628 [Meira miltonrushii]